MKMKFKSYKLFGFTLAEIMIVLTVVGVLTAILLPIVANSAPDKNVMKFKKADTMLKNVIRELVNSNEYYENGDLGAKKGGGNIDAKYLCQTIADIVSAKKVNCVDTETEFGNGYTGATKDDGSFESSMIHFEGDPSVVDLKCINTQNIIGDEIVLTDGTVIFESNPSLTFSHVTNDGKRFFGGGNYNASDTGFDILYKIICIDIDGENGKEKPFAYAVRADGKILPGGRANKWLAKDFQGKDPSEQE